MSEDLLNPIKETIMAGNAPGTESGVTAALEAGVEAASILHDAMIPAMDEVGRLYEEGEYFVPEMLIAARAMKAGLALLKPHLIESAVEPVGRVVVGTVKGDLHDIGKNLVALMLEGAGFEINDLGTDVPPEAFIEAVQHSGAQVVGISALLTTTMPQMKNTIEAFAAAGLRENVKIMIGGAPVTQAYADQIGADGYAPDASQAVALAKSLLGV